MRRKQLSLSAVLISLFSLFSLILAACNNTPTPRPTSTILPSPTFTPSLVIVTAQVSPAPPTWTPLPTKTLPPTSTRSFTATPLPTSTPIPSRTVVGGKPGLVTTDGLLAVELLQPEILAALKAQRPNQFFSVTINAVNFVELDKGVIRLGLNYNNFTAAGMTAELKLSLRSVYGEIQPDLGNIQANGPITGDQAEVGRQILRLALKEDVLPKAVKKYVPLMDKFSVLQVQIEPSRVIVTVKVTGSLPTPLPTSTPTKAPTVASTVAATVAATSAATQAATAAR